ncbi:hypothetical protein H2200_007098 [Cladophialophora chaetospira]|uniref:Uncharacterized protein n=1 Tax=Cladophialophora chaetospira TaxID=386627 RepID=A0AA39CHD1_9EURO|nr:hypothetical protein H2200_007098 [Cladophialophora chaetospira]
MSVIIGALGSIIGYLGAEAATESFFERLLWPERFYNDAQPFILIKLALFLPMAGPLHGAALAALDTFRQNGLYLGIRRGDMLGTTFLPDTGIKAYQISGSGAAQEKITRLVRNGFWVNVLRSVKAENRTARKKAVDPTDPAMKHPPYRAMQLVHHLKLHYASAGSPAVLKAVQISEASVSWRTVLGIVCSEASSIAVAITAGVSNPFRTYWVTGYLLLPLLLKFVALLVCVRREPIEPDKDKTEGQPRSADQLYQIEDPRQGFAIIQGPSSVVLQFFRHYGHPIRDGGTAGRRDRARELLSVGLIYLFVLYFPGGLIGSLWMPDNTQLLWLSFQFYTIVAAHVVRILGWDNCGRTEARIARCLEQKRSVWLRGPGGVGILATLETTDVANVESANQEFEAIIEAHFRQP